jgi:peptide-methionine (S)-S-oxide reductase
LNGVVHTLVGYTGGNTATPTYRKMGNHSESIMVVYDPDIISYRELLECFWRGHDATKEPGSRQYMSAVYYHSTEQRHEIREMKLALAKELGATIFTMVGPAEHFFPAEQYHQKYRLRNDTRLWMALMAIYDDEAQVLGSTVAARINGALGGFYEQERLEREVGDFGLSAEDAAYLIERVVALKNGAMW